MVEYHPITAKDQSKLHQLGIKVLPGNFVGYALCAGGIWKGDFFFADVEELKIWTRQNCILEDTNAKKVLAPKTGDDSYSRAQMEQLS